MGLGDWSLYGIATLVVAFGGTYYAYKSYKKSSSTQTSPIIKKNKIKGDFVMGDKVDGDKIMGNKVVVKKLD